MGLTCDPINQNLVSLIGLIGLIGTVMIDGNQTHLSQQNLLYTIPGSSGSEPFLNTYRNPSNKSYKSYKSYKDKSNHNQNLRKMGRLKQPGGASCNQRR